MSDLNNTKDKIRRLIKQYPPNLQPRPMHQNLADVWVRRKRVKTLSGCVFHRNCSSGSSGK